ncbi:MAG: hypothetical protein ABS35_14520 [Kaistia sp. SCN 65-12]|mgnify:CR=1 FL=1|nr:MAG: hypothetical protein ABS35_14520 [Kaistia sp. SCN 65-12]
MSRSSPRLAASLVLLREDPLTGLQVFMQVRNQKMSFAAGALVFPGGSVEEDDFRTAVDMGQVLSTGSGSEDLDMLVLKIAAIRETFEECGLLLAKRAEGAALSTAEILTLRRDYLEGLPDKPFGAFLASEKLILSASDLIHFAHWITPVDRPKRFDTHFFLARAPSHDAGAHDGAEAIESSWLAPQAAVANAETGLHKLMFPTRMNLLRLMGGITIQRVLDDVSRTPVVTVVPEFVTRRDSQVTLRIPLEAGYGGEFFVIEELASERQQK